MQLDRVLTTLAAFFEREEIRFALIGGLAVHVWGRARPTYDVDLAVDASQADRVTSYLGSLGFEMVFASAAFSIHEHSDPDWGHVDLMYLRGETAERVFAASSMKELVAGHPVPVASPEHLAMMKAVAMKSFPHRALYEGEDVRVLLQVPGVDREAIRAYFERHGLSELFDAIDRQA